MSLTYTNRRGQTYYLHKRQDKSGTIRLHFSMKSEGDLATAVPEGFEIYEHPNGKVYCRRIPRQIIQPQERRLVQEAVKTYTDLHSFIIDVRKNIIIVYTPNTELDDLGNFLTRATMRLSDSERQKLTRYLEYEPAMQFVLSDKKTRNFIAQRYCYLGSIDDWIDISFPGQLLELVQEYLPHLGKESYFDLHLF